ncbi:MAG: aminoglycoside phosphotransferase family protein [Chloroflexaceae bacterium]
MPANTMHPDEVPTDVDLVRRLLAAQFPHWADLPLAPVSSAGTDHALYRLGDDKVVRLPRIPASAAQVDKEQQWLPRLAPYLPLAIPVPHARGTPAADFPWPWSVYPWLAGTTATIDRIADPNQFAADLAHFITALQRIDPTAGPPPGAHNAFRGVPLAQRDAATRAAIAALDGIIDSATATVAWDAALHAPAWSGAPVWIHGDLQAGNLLTVQGHLRAVIDFGCLGVGDPACDLMVAWNLLPVASRGSFRARLNVDDATWARGRGWALSFGLIALPYYRQSNPVLAGIARHTIDAVLAEYTGAA